MQTLKFLTILRNGYKCKHYECRLCKRSISSKHTAAADTDADAEKRPSRRSLLNGPNLRDFFHNENLKNHYPISTERIPYLHKQSYNGASRKVYFDVYGCQMNVNDTEIIWSILKANNFVKCNRLEEADVVLIVTCAIRESAEAKVWNKVDYLKGLRKQRAKRKDRPKLKIGILGCMAERLKDKILEKEKAVDIIAGPDSYKDLPRMLALTDNNQTAVNVLLSLDETYADVMPVRLNENSISAYVSIMRGCDNMCTFCIVPFTRGRERSRPITSIMDEVRNLAEQGVKEITLLGQNVNSYRDLSNSVDVYASPPLNRPTNLAEGFKTVYKSKIGGLRFADLLERVADIDPEVRIRFTSPHPKDFPDDVLQVIQERPNVCKSLHMPAQSGNSVVLERMRRGYTREAYLNLIRHIRDMIPNVAFSSDFICGFCGETEQQFQDTLSLIEAVQYNTAFVFPYSMREKTAAHRRYEDDVPQYIKQKRMEQTLSLHRHIVENLNRQKIGQLQLVLVEGNSKRSNLHLVGRNDANIKVIFPNNEIPQESNNHVKQAKPGDYVVVQINDSTSQVLKGIPLYHSSLIDFYKKNKNTYTRCNDDYLKYTSML